MGLRGRAGEMDEDSVAGQAGSDKACLVALARALPVHPHDRVEYRGRPGEPKAGAHRGGQFPPVRPVASRGMAADMARVLARNVSLGVNPRVTARQMRDEFGAAETRALTIARTESLRAFRAASLMTFAENSDSLDGWIWLSANNKRTCVSCLAMHGSVHPLTEEMQEHINGRCVAAPRVKGANLRVETGAERFERWAEREQRAALGPAMYEAWRDGAVRLTPGGARSVVGVHRNATWGDSVYARSLRAIVGPGRAGGYVERGRIRTEVLASLAHLPTNSRRALLEDRLVEVRAMEQEQVRELLGMIRQQGTIPRLDHHWRKHADGFRDLGVEDAAGYEEYLRGHLSRNDLQTFTYVTTKPSRDRMWVMAGMDNGVIAQYNETRGQFWSFFRQREIDRFVAEMSAYWVEVIEGESGFRFVP